MRIWQTASGRRRLRIFKAWAGGQFGGFSRLAWRFSSHSNGGAGRFWGLFVNTFQRFRPLKPLFTPFLALFRPFPYTLYINYVFLLYTTYVLNAHFRALLSIKYINRDCIIVDSPLVWSSKTGLVWRPDPVLGGGLGFLARIARQEFCNPTGAFLSLGSFSLPGGKSGRLTTRSVWTWR